MTQTTLLSTMDLARKLGVSRIAIFKKIKKGQIKATKIGKSYVIDPADIGNILDTTLTPADTRLVDLAVKKTVLEYGEALRLLGKE